MEKDKIIVIGAGDIGSSVQKIAEKLGKDVNDIVLVDDFKKAKDILKDNVYHNEVVKSFEELKVYTPASEMTKKEINAPLMQHVRTEPKIYNNQICPCGSGKKFKKCCKK